MTTFFTIILKNSFHGMNEEGTLTLILSLNLRKSSNAVHRGVDNISRFPNTGENGFIFTFITLLMYPSFLVWSPDTTVIISFCKVQWQILTRFNLFF